MQVILLVDSPAVATGAIILGVNSSPGAPRPIGPSQNLQPGQMVLSQMLEAQLNDQVVQVVQGCFRQKEFNYPV